MEHADGIAIGVKEKRSEANAIHILQREAHEDLKRPLQ
jgi:hypothetical protein